MKLENWFVTKSGIPGDEGIYITGHVFGHPRIKDGENMTTSALISVEGKKIKTEMGKEYELGTPCAEFVEWSKQHNCHIPTEKEPIQWST